MKKFLTLSIIASLFLLSLSVNAQVSYSFSALSGTYTSISGGTTATLVSPSIDYPAADEGFANGLPIGFTFVYDGVSYTSVNADANGFLTLGTAFTADDLEDYYFNSLTAGTTSLDGVRPIIAPLWDDLVLETSSDLTYKTTGSAPNRVFTIEWANALWDWNADGPGISFQVKLYETTNVIDFVYKRESGATSTPSASIGLTAVRRGTGNFLSLDGSSTSPSVSSTEETSDIGSKPGNNQIYRFTPLECIAPSITDLTNVTPTSATFSWNAIPGISDYEYATSTSSTPPSSGTAISSTSTNISGLTPGVNNFFYVRSSCSDGIFSEWSRRAIVLCTTNVSPADGATGVSPVATTISWNAVSDATGYTLMFSTDGINYVEIGNVDGTTTSTTINPDYSTNYSFYVRPVIGSDTASISCQSNATSFTTLDPPAAPANDDCGNATDLSLAPVNATTLGATQYLSMDAEECNGFAGNANDDVWFKFTAISNGTAVISLTNATAGLDAVIQVYTGTCGSFTPLDCADATLDAGNETLTLPNLISGETYYFRVYGYGEPVDGGTFTLQLSGSALPITLGNFRGEHNGEKNILSWTTQTEYNSKGFQLEKSPDGNHFIPLDFVYSKAPGGNSTATLDYTYNDTKPFAGNSYYRLKQVDNDDKFVYSNIVLLKGFGVSKLQLSLLYPNPAKSELNMILTSPSNSRIKIIVSDVTGRAVMQQTTSLVSGDNNLKMNIEKLSAGSYVIKATCNDDCGNVIKKFVKQ
jgi:hypothetical protein